MRAMVVSSSNQHKCGTKLHVVYVLFVLISILALLLQYSATTSSEEWLRSREFRSYIYLRLLFSYEAFEWPIYYIYLKVCIFSVQIQSITCQLMISDKPCH
jgi:hypothetical protein